MCNVLYTKLTCVILHIRVSTAKSLNLSNTLFDILGNEHTGSDGTNISCVGKIGALTGGSWFTFSFSDGLALSNIKLIAISTLPSANDRYCCAVASLSPDGSKTIILLNSCNYPEQDIILNMSSILSKFDINIFCYKRKTKLYK